MPDRTEDNNEIEALDQRVDELLADVEQTAGRIDAAIPNPPGEDEPDQFESGESVLGQPSAKSREQKPAAEPPRQETPSQKAPVAPTAPTSYRTLPSSPDDVMREAANELEGASSFASAAAVLGQEEVAAAAAKPDPKAKKVESGAAEPVAEDAAAHETAEGAAEVVEAAVGEAAAEEPAAPEMSAEEFSSPDAIAKLDEKLAESASELSDRAGSGEVVDDRDHESLQDGAAEAAASRAGDTDAAPVSAPAPKAPPAPVPTAAAAPVAAAAPTPTPAPAPVVPEAKETETAAATVEAKPGISIASIVTVGLSPLASFTMKLSPTARQTIAYAAVVTLFQAACLWGFLAFKGPPGEPVPMSDPVILRHEGDPPASHDAHKATSSGHAAPKKAASKPKAAAKPDAHADAGHH